MSQKSSSVYRGGDAEATEELKTSTLWENSLLLSEGTPSINRGRAC